MLPGEMNLRQQCAVAGELLDARPGTDAQRGYQGVAVAGLKHEIGDAVAAFGKGVGMGIGIIKPGKGREGPVVYRESLMTQAARSGAS